MFVPSTKLIQAEENILSLDPENMQSGDQLFSNEVKALRSALRLLQEAQIEMNQQHEEGRLVKVWGGKKAIIVNDNDEVTIRPGKF